jgi:hypothetical protein
MDKQNKCSKDFDAFNYTDDQIKEMSLVRKYYNCNVNNICNLCNKQFSNNRSLKTHQKNVCKEIKMDNKTEIKIDNNIEKDNTKTIESLEKENIINSNNVEHSTITEHNNNVEHSTIMEHSNNTDNSVDNSVNNNYINITIVNSFDQKWSTDHIDDKMKFILLLNNSKFTSTLENILENEVNLNVLLDNDSKNGLVYENNALKKITVKDIVAKTMEKLHKHLADFSKDIGTYDISKDVIDSQMKLANKKYNNYKLNKETQKSVNTCIQDIYHKKQKKAVSVINKTNDNIQTPEDICINGF